MNESWMENMVIPIMMKKTPVRFFSNIGCFYFRGLRDLSKSWARVISVSMVPDAMVNLIVHFWRSTYRSERASTGQ